MTTYQVIEVGDKVVVEYIDGEKWTCTVNHRPNDVGDMWYFEDEVGRVFAQNPTSSRLDRIIRLPAGQGAGGE